MLKSPLTKEARCDIKGEFEAQVRASCIGGNVACMLKAEAGDSSLLR